MYVYRIQGQLIFLFCKLWNLDQKPNLAYNMSIIPHQKNMHPKYRSKTIWRNNNFIVNYFKLNFNLVRDGQKDEWTDLTKDTQTEKKPPLFYCRCVIKENFQENLNNNYVYTISFEGENVLLLHVSVHCTFDYIWKTTIYH